MANVFEEIAQIEEQQALYREALKTLSTGKQHTMPDGESLEMADLPEIRRTLRWLAREKEKLESPGLNILRGRPKR